MKQFIALALFGVASLGLGVFAGRVDAEAPRPLPAKIVWMLVADEASQERVLGEFQTPDGCWEAGLLLQRGEHIRRFECERTEIVAR